jgi:hypothetical protein
VIAITIGKRTEHLARDEAAELVQRLRRRDPDSSICPATVVATKVEQLLDDPGSGSDLRLLDSEEDELAWTIYEWIDEAGADKIATRVMDLRYALDAPNRITLTVGSCWYSLPGHQATTLAEDLRRKAVGQLGTEGTEGALGVADDIEAVLVGSNNNPISLEGDRAEAVFYILNVSIINPGSPLVADAYSLYQALRVPHDNHIRD